MSEYRDMICSLKDVVGAEIAKGIMSPEVCGEAVGQITDMIKDLEEGEKNHYEACYYKLVCAAMMGSEPEFNDEERRMMGYNHRHLNNGEFASAGRGHMVYGYPMHPDMRRMEYTQNYMDDPKRFEEEMKHHRSGYTTSDMSPEYARHGEDYDGYRRARRHYTDSKSPEAKEEMNSRTKMYVGNIVHNLREMWDTADPTLRKEMKDDLSKLLGDMK